MYACRIEATMLSTTLSVLLAVYLLPDFSHGHTNQSHFRADYTYIEKFGSYYKFHSRPKQWRDAKRVCSEEGASLFYPENNHEASAVISFWKRSRNNAQRGTTWVYIGMSDIITEGVYETIDGKPISEVYNNWNSNQPDDFYGYEDCVLMNEGGRLNDIPCLQEYSFICKKSVPPPGPTYNCQQSKLDVQKNPTNIRKDYNYMETFKSYYKFHITPKPWRDAKRMCSEEGASLFYPENTAEANAVISFWKSAKNDTQRGTTDTWHTHWLYVGISDIITEGVFETIDGKSISEVYSNWNSGQSDNYNDIEDCVHMSEGGRLNDIPCDTEFSFICKKSCQQFQDGHTNQSHFRADYTYIEKFGSYYKFHSRPKQWRDAKRVCSEEGASLFYPENNHEASAVISFWKRSRNNAQRGTTWVYIGMSDIITEGVYETIDGKPISEVYNNWNSNQPDDFYGYEDCVLMNEGGRLNDIPCLQEYSFICKKSVPPPDPTYNCQQSKLDVQKNPTNIRKDYNYMETFKSYYKFHITPKPWRDAKRMCSEEGASLFYPENTAEANAVISFWKSAKNDTQRGTTDTWHTHWLYVGISDIITEGVFETIDGKSISEVYSNWNSGQSDNYNDIEDCVHMSEGGRLNDIPCDTEFSFICKKSCQQFQDTRNYNYIEAVDSFYKIHTTPRTFADAKQTCALEGASLFYPDDKKEAHVVIEFWNKNHPSTDWAVYVGLTDMKREGKFQTNDGRPISDVYKHWRKDEPNNHGPGEEDCVILYRQGDMNDVQCDDKYRFICKRLPSQKWNDHCNMANSDYTFSKNTGNCYKLHTTPLTWTEAYDVCRAEQSHLAVINNALEADYLVNLTKSVAKQWAHRSKRIYHLGVQNVPNKGWQTVTGQRISDADTLWANILPASKDTKKCGSMWHTGVLRTNKCNTKGFFICEHELDGPTESSFSLDIEENL